MNQDPHKYSSTTPDGYTVSAITNTAVVQCTNPRGGSVISGILVLDTDSVLVFKNLDSNQSFSGNGLKALAAVMDGMEADMGQTEGELEAAKAKASKILELLSDAHEQWRYDAKYSLATAVQTILLQDWS